MHIGSLGFIQGLCTKGSDQTVQTDGPELLLFLYSLRIFLA